MNYPLSLPAKARMINWIKYCIFFFESVAIFMTVFFFLQYSIIKRREHLNYALYLFCLSVYYLLALPEIFFDVPISEAEKLDAFNLFKRPVQFLSSVFYTYFVIYYLGLESKSRFLYRFFNGLILLYLIASLCCLACNIFKIPYDLVYYIFSLLLFPLQVYVLAALFKHKVPYSNYIIWGSIIIVVSSSFTLVLSLYLYAYDPGNAYSNARSYFPVLAGILLDIFLFTIALQKKIADNEKALINSAYARQQAILLERERIIADLHDDVGGGLSSIRMMSDLMQQQNEPGKNPVVSNFAAKISFTAKDIAQRMHTIIWSLNAENDSVENFIEYVRQYGVSFFESTPISFQCEGSHGLYSDVELSGVQRKNLFLIMKEAFHNIIKHSRADTAKVTISMMNKRIIIEVSDNGKGIEKGYHPAVGSGNGLKNMKKRMEEIGGHIVFSAEKGTAIRIDLEV